MSFIFPQDVLTKESPNYSGTCEYVPGESDGFFHLITSLDQIHPSSEQFFSVPPPVGAMELDPDEHAFQSDSHFPVTPSYGSNPSPTTTLSNSISSRTLSFLSR
jgi:hypothetical protein